jgi:hypothetical protein
MAWRLPRLSVEPAPGYRPFVESHLPDLRRDAQRLAGDGLAADEMVCGALTDVALRWPWFELARRRLGRPDPAGEFLDTALVRRCARWQPEAPESPVEVTVTEWAGWWEPPRPRAGTSAAVRVAAAAAGLPSTPSAVLEAAIAWVHAYQTYNRYRRVAAAVLVAVVVLLLTRLRMSWSM